MVTEAAPRLLRLAQVAAMLQVHPKTVYYWVRTGRLSASTSPGGLLRVRAEDARALCQSSGLPVPAELSTVKRRVHVLEDDKALCRSVVRALKPKGFDVRVFEDVYDAIIATAKEPPEALVVDARTDDTLCKKLIAALGRDESTKRTRVLAFVDGESAALGAEVALPAGDVTALLRALK